MNPSSNSTRPDSPSNPAGTNREREGLLRHSVAGLLAALVVLFVTAPFIQVFDQGRYIEALLMTAVLIAAVLAVGGRRRTLATAIILAIPVLAGRWVHHFRQQDSSYAFFAATFFIFLAFVVFHFLRFILRAPRVNSEVLCAAISIYLMLGVLWASAYVLVARLGSGAFSVPATTIQPLAGFDALYFSLLTLTTVGYGDITPVSGPARMLAMLEAVTGTMYMAVLVARLVAGYSSEGRAGDTNK